MNKEIAEQAPDISEKKQKVTRARRSTFEKIALVTAIIGTIAGIGGFIALTLLANTVSPDMAALLICALLSLILLISRVRWAPIVTTLLGLVSLYVLFHQPFVIESLTNPYGPNGGIGKFIGLIINISNAFILTGASLAAAIQQYQPGRLSTARWLAPGFSAITGMIIGSIVIGIISPVPPPQAIIPPVPPLQAPQMAAGPGVPTTINMGMPKAPTSLTQLQAPQTTTHVDHFTFTAQPAHLTLSSGITVPAWTFNGTAPGPTLHVRQGDELVVTLINHLSFGVTIHWHGIRIANADDGVAGVTQDAVKPGQSYVYRFVVPDAGTYWYHSHQFSYEETTNGLYGMLIVDPATPTLHADVDYSVALHTWNGPGNQSVYTMNATAGELKQQARPGQWVRLRIANTAETPSGNPQLVTLIGAPFQVVSLDGHDLHAPQWLTATPLPIGSAQRYDLFFQMPSSGTVALVTASDSQNYAHTPALIVGQGSLPTQLPAITKWFDLTSYGTPTSDTITPQTHFDQTYNIALGNQMGTSMGRSGMTYTMNGKVFPDTAMLMVKEGQIIKLHFTNQTNLYHPMHLHGHVFTVLAENGQALTGSPIHQDTVLIPPHDTYDVAFVADNPGIWMLHCHNFLHANWGMDMMVMYDVSTPYTVGTQSGNFPD